MSSLELLDHHKQGIMRSDASTRVQQFTVEIDLSCFVNRLSSRNVTTDNERQATWLKQESPSYLRTLKAFVSLRLPPRSLAELVSCDSSLINSTSVRSRAAYPKASTTYISSRQNDRAANG
ncbi:hypothetical protein H2248_005378 [Termitomyces sp. 'cryptogamus']|nr:hypothetical protein H2248_005378 [Termitomyces sp. 'cryptogamus']